MSTHEVELKTMDQQASLTDIAKESVIKAHNPVKLSFHNLKFEVEVTLDKKEAAIEGKSSKKLQVIKDVSGYAMPG